MYIWNLFKTLIYLPFCCKKCVYSNPNEEVTPAKLTPIKLNLFSTPLDDEYTYQKIDKQGIYAVKKGYGFASVEAFQLKSRDVYNIWKAKNTTEYAHKVVLIETDVKGMYKLLINLVNGSKKEFIKKIQTPWTEIGVRESIQVPLNICVQHNTKFYFVDKDKDTKIFVPRRGFVFDSVISWIDTADVKWTIWKANNKNGCADNIEFTVYKSMKPHFGLLMIYLTNGDRVKLINDNVDNKVNPWISVDPDGDIAIQINISNSESSFCYHNYLQGHITIFEAKQGFVFNGLFTWDEKLKKSDIIWQTLKPEDYAIKVMYEIVNDYRESSNIIIFHLNAKVTHLKLLDDGWSPIEPSIILNLSHKCFHIGYKYYKDKYKIESFIPFGNYLFKGVNDLELLSFEKEVEIWKARNKSEYAKMVFLVPLGKKSKYLIIILVNNDFLVYFKRDGFQPWVLQPKDKDFLDDLRRSGIRFRGAKYIKNDVIESQTKPPEKISAYHPEDKEEMDFDKKSEIDPEKLIELDINKMHRIKGYEITYKVDKVIFTAKEPYLFNIVKCGEDVLWRQKHLDEYPEKVIYKVVNGIHKVKVYFPNDERLKRTKSKHLINFNPAEVQVMVVNS